MGHSPPTSCEPDILFDILANSRRRHLIALLREHEKTDRIFLDTLSSQLAEYENAVDEAIIEIAITLHHHHLPKLDEAGFIRYDPSIKMIEFTGLSDDPSVDGLNIAIGDD